MTSEEVAVAAPLQNESTNDTVLPQVGVFVTADVRVVQYGSSDSLVNGDDTKCTIVTSLSAVINESLNRTLQSQPYSRSKESVADTTKSPVLLREACDHPNVRRSKKHTQLNRTNINEFTVDRRAQIDRTVLLPYLGCTRRFEPFQSKHTYVLAKSSKSWEAVGKSNTAKNVKPFRSQTFNNCGLLNNASSELSVLDYQTKERLLYSYGEYELQNTGLNTSKEAVRSFYLIKTPISGPKIFSNHKNTVEKDYNVGRHNYNEFPAVSYRNKNELHKNITGIDANIFPTSAKLNLKTTRNVSILHRPKTRDKSTSTTFLDGGNVGKELNKSIQELLTPYIASGRDFPSEMILKLVPKAEALRNSSNESTDQGNRSKYSSEVDLLAPTLNDGTKHKKKSGKSFWNCFSNKKNTSNESLEKEVYFPSIVEVQNKNRKSYDHSNPDLENSVCSFYSVDHKNKRL